MGMSDDFEVAVEEGATLVRIGSAYSGRRSDMASVFDKILGFLGVQDRV